MTIHTPVVLSDNDTITAIAETRGWTVITRDGTTLRVRGTDATTTMPLEQCQIERGALAPDLAPLWSGVLDWLAEHAPHPMMVVAPNDYASDLAQWAAAHRGWPIGVWVDDPTPVRSAATIALVASCEGVLFADEETRAAFTGAWPTLIRDLPDLPRLSIEPPSAAVPATTRDDRVLRVLLVAYYSGPNPTVAVQRPTYWFENIETLSGGTITVDIVTAAPWPDPPARVHIVPDMGPAALAPTKRGTEPWAMAVTALADHQLFRPSREVAGYWNLSLERYFEQRDDHFDVVICTGNPFSHFEFARFAQRHWYARAVLDYRDPFALNPRTDLSHGARAAAAHAEDGWNMSADLITVVAPAWIDYLVPGGPDTRVEVIGNGYDERVEVPDIPAERAPGPHRFGHAGQFFPSTPPDTLLHGLSRSGAELHHMGAPITDTGGARTTQYGRLPRQQVLEVLVGLDCGVAWITRARTEIPTKVFDYIVAGLDVLILHRGEHEDSPLWGLLRDVDGVHWVEDDPEAVDRFLADYVPTRHTEPDRSAPLSRRESTTRLLPLLQQVGGREPSRTTQ